MILKVTDYVSRVIYTAFNDSLNDFYISIVFDSIFYTVVNPCPRQETTRTR